VNDPEVTMHDAIPNSNLTGLLLFDEVRAMTWRLLHPDP
jgi:hypothetical protein